MRDEVLKALEEARNNKLIGTGLRLRSLSPRRTRFIPCCRVTPISCDTCSLSPAVTLTQASGNGTGGVHVEVKKADGLKCERCWNYSIHVGEDKNYPTVCERCSAVLKGTGRVPLVGGRERSLDNCAIIDTGSSNL